MSDKKIGWTKAQQKYAQSSKGKLARKKYQESEKGREARKRYMANRRGKLKDAKQIEQTIPVENEAKEVKIKKEAVSKK